MAAAQTSTSLEDRLGYRFTDPDLLGRALKHRSWCSEFPGEPSNERLEFLGDAVLELVVTDHLFTRFGNLAEGQLAKVRAHVVSGVVLAEVGSALGLGEGLRLGRGEERSGGREKGSILADATEAVIGAIYLDGGMEAASEFVLAQLWDMIDAEAARPGATDYKTRLQEGALGMGLPPPVYSITRSGPEHLHRFHATVSVGTRILGSGDGSSKKEAEQRAARVACAAQHSGSGLDGGAPGGDLGQAVHGNNVCGGNGPHVEEFEDV